MRGNETESARLLVVSRDFTVLRPLWAMGESSDWQLESAANAWEAMERVQSGGAPDLFLLDLPPRDADGLDILRWLLRLRPGLAIILLGYPEDNGKKQEAIRLGARDYLVRPFDGCQLGAVIRRHLSTAGEMIETDLTSDDAALIGDDTFFIGTSPIMRELRAQAALLAEAGAPVLILGEGGSGKETTARLIHALSARSHFEFAKVNCAALPSDLLERELFGCKRDGASGSARTTFGKLELCAKGTILLDEITEMPLSTQAKLLEVLQKKRFIRPRTSASIEFDVHVVTTSTTNWEHTISENRLHQDLYSRLSAHTIHVPPLRERKEDLPLLLRHFMHRLARHYGLSPRDFTPAILEACQACSWPGNLRELESFVKRYLVAAEQKLAGEKSRPDADGAAQNASFAMPRSLSPAPPSPMQLRPGATGSLRSMVQSAKSEVEWSAIAAALEKTDWNRKAAAQSLKISYRTLLYKIEQYKMRSSDSSLSSGESRTRSKGTGLRGKWPDRSS